MDADFAISVIIAVFAIVNPVGNVSFFVALTEGYSKEERNSVIWKVVTVAFFILVIFSLAGHYIFEVFSITIPAFRIAGGILLFSIAFSMLHGTRSKAKLTDQDKEEAMNRQAIGIVPLGIPMFGGPGAITTVMIYMADGSADGFSLTATLMVILAILITMVASYFILYYGEAIFERIGRMGTLAFSRIMGLILAAIAVQFVLTGILGFAILEGLV